MRALCLTEAEEEVALFFYTKYIFPQGLWIPPGWMGGQEEKLGYPNRPERTLFMVNPMPTM